MKRLICLAVPVFFILVVSAQASAAPAPTLFAYNDAAKECGTYMGGDEYVYVALPAGWKTYDYQKSVAKTTQAYCDELGYKNVGKVAGKSTRSSLDPLRLRSASRTDIIWVAISIVAVFLAIIATILIVIKKGNKKVD